MTSQAAAPCRSAQLAFKPRGLSTESYSLAIILISSLLYSIMGCFLQLATKTGIPPTELVFIRAVFQGSVVVSAMLCLREGPPIQQQQQHNEEARLSTPGIVIDAKKEGDSQQSSRQRRRLILVPLGAASMQTVVVLRGAVGGMGFVLYFYTLSCLPLGDAVALLSLHPIVTVFAAAVVLGEPIYLHIVASVATVVGASLIAEPSFIFHSSEKNAAYQSFGYVTAALGNCTGAGVFVLIRKAGKSGAHTLQLLFSWVCFGLLFSLLFGVVLSKDKSGWVAPSFGVVYAYIAGCLVFGSTAHFLFNFAARHGNPGLASIVRSSGIMWAYLIQVVVFHEIPILVTCFGVILVSASLIMVSVQKIWDYRAKEEETLSVDCETPHDRANLISRAQQIGYGATESMEVRPLTSE
jgi:drug/metabolite transporter (DMT)-like permease